MEESDYYNRQFFLIKLKYRKMNKFIYLFNVTIIALVLSASKCKSDTEVPGGCSSCPEVTSITPSAAYAGETVTIVGKNFGKDATKVTVAFSDKNVKANSISQTGDNITVIVPEPSSANEGKEVAVVVKAPAPNGSTILESTINGKFTYKSPTIQSFSPVSGVFGTTVTITGDFGSNTLSKVLFNGIEA
jgi:IPT/TIG domain